MNEINFTPRPANLMVDLETMGKSSSAAIIAIGAVQFDPIEGTLGKEFYATIDLESSMASGGLADASTILWWMRQGDAARSEFAREGRELLPVLREFANFIDVLRSNGHDVGIWGNGAAFDNVILANAYANAHLPLPWKHWEDRCYRTVAALHPDIPRPRFGVHHNALDDAKTQAHHLMQILKPATPEIARLDP